MASFDVWASVRARGVSDAEVLTILAYHVVPLWPTGFDGISDGMKDFMDRCPLGNTSLWRFNE